MNAKNTNKTTAKNTNSKKTKTNPALPVVEAPSTLPPVMSLAPTHVSQPEMFQGTRPGVTVTIEGPSPEFVAEDVAALMSVPAEGSKPTRAPKGLDRAAVLALCAGLQLTEKSSSHYGDPKGARLVVPKGSITRLYVYKLPDATDLPGHRTAEQRKTEGLGAVTHVIENPTLDQVKVLVEAVTKAQAPEPTSSAEGTSGKKKGQTKAKASDASETTPDTQERS